MNRNSLVALSILISGALISSGIIGSAYAQTITQKLLQPQEQKMPGDIKYPISELGNCSSKANCKVFCDNSKNADACLTFATKYKLLSSEELAAAKKFSDNGMIGPGGCKGQAECDQYCGNSIHMEECMTFAEENGMMTDQQLQDSQKMLTAIKKGIKPPTCSGPEQCNTYCSSSEHMAECMTFNLEAGLVPDNQKEQTQKTLDALKKGIKPPACHGPQECDTYCSSSEHMAECMTFSLEAGLVPADQKVQMQKTLEALKNGIKPPACQPNKPNQSSQSNQLGQLKQPSQSVSSLEPCDQYCSNHIEECVKFSVATGNMTEQQAQVSIKTGGKGPGECVGKEACDAFCSNTDNQETCFNFGKDNGLIPQEDLQKMTDGQQKMKDSFSQIPQEVLTCITSSLGADTVEKMKTGAMIPQKSGEAINQCFQKFGTQGKEQNQNQNGQNQQNQNQLNQHNQPWADMCKPNVNGNPTELACVDGSGKFVSFAKVGSDGKPVCPAESTAKCGNYPENYQQEQQNQQVQSGDKFQPRPGAMNPGSQQMPQQAGPGGCKTPEECNIYCQSHQDECKNSQPQQNQLGQPSQIQPQQQQQPFNPDNQPIQIQSGQLDQFNQFNQLNQINQPNQLGQPGTGQMQPGEIQPQQQPQNQIQPPPLPLPSSFIQKTQKLLGSVLNAFLK